MFCVHSLQNIFSVVADPFFVYFPPLAMAVLHPLVTYPLFLQVSSQAVPTSTSGIGKPHPSHAPYLALSSRDRV